MMRCMGVPGAYWSDDGHNYSFDAVNDGSGPYLVTGVVAKSGIW